MYDSKKALGTKIKHLKKRINFVKLNMTKKTVIYLGGNLGSIEIEEGSRNQLLSQGDDGFVVKSTQNDEPKTYIIKVYKAKLREKEYNKSQEVQDELKKIVQDQALREFTCLKLLQGHPNIFPLLSSEIDSCRIKLEDESEYMPETSALRLSYIPRLQQFVTWFPDFFQNKWAQYLGVILQDEALIIDFEHRNNLARYLFGQAASLAHALKEHNIYHRDIDSCNISIQMPQLRLYLMDFARAKLPGMEDPDTMHGSSEELQRKSKKIKKSYNDEGIFSLDYELSLMKRQRYLNYNNTHNFKREDRLFPSQTDVEDRELLFHYIKLVVYDYAAVKVYLSEQDNLKKTIIDYAKSKFITNLADLLPWSKPPEEDLKKFAIVLLHFDDNPDEKWYLKSYPITHSSGFTE